LTLNSVNAKVVMPKISRGEEAENIY